MGGRCSYGIRDRVVSKVNTSTSSVEAWGRMIGLFANPSSSRIIGLTGQLTTINLGTLPIKDYLGKLQDLAKELAFVNAHVLETNLIIHTLNALCLELRR
ncbi:hypothetical protein Dsin_030284 [Dipteronia sinensis]|uniref:Uncharacterized protein n=1 Tax=Dipteronia sinensis TaxID=43782 RepID=A0AAD9ZJS0_9ROSI|nr:hypothetical protein Dsin_030284 [Dipteronia sinensis]